MAARASEIVAVTKLSLVASIATRRDFVAENKKQAAAMLLGLKLMIQHS